MSIWIIIPAFIVTIGILVSVHEFGHFWVARKLGIRVLRFSIGFGKPIWRKVGSDGVEYLISAIPLGGYVKMLDSRDCNVTPEEHDLAFNHKPIPSRIAVLVAGPLFNFFFAIFAYWLMFVIGVPGLKPYIGNITEETPAARAGLESQDQIVRVGDRDVATWDGAIIALLDELIDDAVIPMRVLKQSGSERDTSLVITGDVSKLTEPNALFSGLGFDVYRPPWPAVVGSVEAGRAADRAGLAAGDKIVSAEGEAIDSWNQWVTFIRARANETVSVEVLRGGSRILKSMTIGETQTQDGQTIGLIGARVEYPTETFEQYRAVRRHGMVDAVPAAVAELWKMSTLTVKMFGKMLSGQVSLKNITGPVRIAEFAGVAASSGAARYLNFLAILSISLGILNLLPIPMLDGGQVVYQVVEGIKGSPLSQKAELLGQQVGILLLLTLMGFAFYNDITHIFLR
ncbi:MAG: RIP metalloprotease RseP [Pseudomonadota bacterium]